MGYADPEQRRQYARKHYLANKQLYIDRANRRTAQLRVENRQHIMDYLMEHPCVDCGESDVVVLQFDHVRDDKTYEVGRMISGGYSWATIKAEIDRCEVVCANCHFRRTASRHGGWARARVMQMVDITAPNAV